MRFMFGTGERLATLVPFSVLTSLLVVGRFSLARVFRHTGEEGAETTRVVGFMPNREFPFGNSLLRMVLMGCSRAFAGALG
jgi:hypothetical protein